jgi:hypothetical protein
MRIALARLGEQAPGFFAGALAVLLLGGLTLSIRLRDIESCAFDWGVFWTAAQTIAVILGATIALFQLRRYTNIERSKATTELISVFLVGEVARAYALVDDGDEPQFLSSGITKRLTLLGAHDRTAFNEIKSAIDLLNSYLGSASNLLLNDVIDGTLYLNNMTTVVLRMYIILKAIQQEAQEAGAGKFRIFFSDLARAAQKALLSDEHAPLSFDYYKSLVIE